jgi:predicted pyridoxine 5'-phosphate oxidase superfamily flavin-nucleotide-binding protein
MDFYHSGMRELQDRYEGRSVADRLAGNRMRATFNDEDRRCIESSAFFFLATSTADNVDCSFKGGVPGFVRVVGDNVIAWPDYDGNRMYRSLGNILRNPRVGLLFIRFDGTLFNNASRLRINGHAEIDESAEVIVGLPGAKRLIRVTAEHIFTNCPRYIPKLSLEEQSVYVPRAGYRPPDPPWKSMPFVKDIFEGEQQSKEE